MRKKKNGCSCPLHPKQVLTWVALTLSASEFILASYFISSLTERALALGLFGLAAVATLYYGILVTLSCPDAYSLKLSELAKLGHYDLDIDEYPQICHTCDACIKRTTKHCMNCDKCIEHFDHHCKWVNNCIGKRNYHNFVWLVLASTVQFAVFFSVNCVVLVQFVKDDEEFHERSETLVGINGSLVLGFVLTFGIVEALVIMSLVYLLAFHFYLRVRGLTTFEYITRKRRSALSVVPADLPNNTSNNLSILENSINK